MYMYKTVVHIKNACTCFSFFIFLFKFLTVHITCFIEDITHPGKDMSCIFECKRLL